MARSPSGAHPALPVPERDPDGVRRAVEEILARSEFRDDRSLQQRVLDWVFEQVERVLSLVFGGGGTLSAWIVVAVLTVVAVVLALRVVAGMRRDPAGSLGAGDVGRPAVDWEAEAAGHEAAGRWREAVRCRYRGVVADLAARGIVDEVPGRTAGAYRRAVAAASPDVAEPFDEVTGIFEATWYGGRDAGPEESSRLADLAAAVAGRRTPVGAR